jgi:sugar phosphate isomerase/epimerase
MRYRHSVARRQMDALFDSLSVILDRTSAVAIAIENRKELDAFPTHEELAVLLSTIESPRLGYWHDMAHARVYQAITGLPRSEWTRLAGCRCLGVHVQDSICGGPEHLAPGTGTETWDDPCFGMASVAFVLEMSSANSLADVQRGVHVLGSLLETRYG